MHLGVPDKHLSYASSMFQAAPDTSPCPLPFVDDARKLKRRRTDHGQVVQANECSGSFIAALLGPRSNVSSSPKRTVNHSAGNGSDWHRAVDGNIISNTAERMSHHKTQQLTKSSQPPSQRLAAKQPSLPSFGPRASQAAPHPLQLWSSLGQLPAPTMAIASASCFPANHGRIWPTPDHSAGNVAAFWAPEMDAKRRVSSTSGTANASPSAAATELSIQLSRPALIGRFTAVHRDQAWRAAADGLSAATTASAATALGMFVARPLWTGLVRGRGRGSMSREREVEGGRDEKDRQTDRQTDRLGGREGGRGGREKRRRRRRRSERGRAIGREGNREAETERKTETLRTIPPSPYLKRIFSSHRHRIPSPTLSK